MTRSYLLRRILQVVPTCAGILLVGFLLIHLAPGDPVLALAGDSGDEAYYARIRAQFGLDQPLARQLLTYVANVFQGDLGTSYVQGRSALTIVLERLPATFLLTGTALGVSTIAGIAAGCLSARRTRRAGDVAVNLATLALYAAPVFLVGQLGVLLFSLRLGWFPVQGMTDARAASTGFAAVLDVAHHLALPALVLASQEIAAVARLTRQGLLEELGRDHIRTARAKGVPERWVLLKHALRRALVPVVTLIGGRVGQLVGGTIVVEAVFGWPGVGRLLITSVQARDIPIVLAVFLVVAVSVVVANLLTDLAYARLDPRIRFR